MTRQSLFPHMAMGLMLLVLAGSPVSGKQPAADPVLIVQRMQSAYADVQDLSASFTQVAYSASLDRSISEEGRIALKRPGWMRWEYVTPEEKLFLARRDETLFYVPADNQVIAASREQLRETGVTALLLDGEPDLLSTYDVSLSEQEEVPRRHLMLRFEPRTPTSYAYALVEIDERDALARRIVIVEESGNRTEYRFDDLEVNAGLDTSLFEWAPPPGVEVVRREP